MPIRKHGPSSMVASEEINGVPAMANFSDDFAQFGLGGHGCVHIVDGFLT